MNVTVARTATGSRGLVVALDGPGSSGKSTVGAGAAERVGYRFCDTGLLYRAVTWLAIQSGLPDADTAGLVALVDAVRLEADDRGRLSTVIADGVQVRDELHGPAVDARVPAISSIPEVRAALIGRQRALAAQGSIVMAGRDIGTVILPDADLKIYLDASVEERARRRAGERAISADLPAHEELLAALRRRDAMDSGRPVAPLRPAGDALILRTDGNTVGQTVDLVVGAIRAAETRRPPSPGGVRVHPSGASRRPLPVTPIAGHLTPLIQLCSLVMRLAARIVTRVRIEGDLSAIPRTGPFILVANHASNADALIVGSFIPPKIGRRLNWLGKREMFDWPLIGWLARHGGIHAVERTAVDVDAFRLAQRILDAGHGLAVFPEGTRSRTGALQEVKDGLAVLAQRSGAPVVPVAIVDSDLVWPRGRTLPRFGGRIVIRVGTPFTLQPDAGARGADRRSAKSAATRQMMDAIAGMLPVRQRGAYAGGVATLEP